jgi:hypothetical protein
MSVLPVDTAPRSAGHARKRDVLKQWSLDNSGVAETLDLSASRTYDCAVEIRHAYKLTGNFCVDLEIVLDDLGVLDQVTFEAKPKSLLSDCREVEFRPKHHVPAERLAEILCSISSRIGADPTPRLWARLFG